MVPSACPLYVSIDRRRTVGPLCAGALTIASCKTRCLTRCLTCCLTDCLTDSRLARPIAYSSAHWIACPLVPSHHRPQAHPLCRPVFRQSGQLSPRRSTPRPPRYNDQPLAGRTASLFHHPSALPSVRPRSWYPPLPVVGSPPRMQSLSATHRRDPPFYRDPSRLRSARLARRRPIDLSPGLAQPPPSTARSKTLSGYRAGIHRVVGAQRQCFNQLRKVKVTLRPSKPAQL